MILAIAPISNYYCQPVWYSDRFNLKLSISESHNAEEATGILAQQKHNSEQAVNLAEARINEINGRAPMMNKYVNMLGQHLGTIINYLV